MAAAVATASVASVAMARTMSCFDFGHNFCYGFSVAFVITFAMVFAAAAMAVSVAVATAVGLQPRLWIFGCNYGYGFGCVHDYGYDHELLWLWQQIFL